MLSSALQCSPELSSALQCSPVLSSALQYLPMLYSALHALRDSPFGAWDVKLKVMEFWHAYLQGPQQDMIAGVRLVGGVNEKVHSRSCAQLVATLVEVHSCTHLLP